jgi:predicted CDP-diglyceride synthetase/phosphatidate cytidylyltransferase
LPFDLLDLLAAAATLSFLIGVGCSLMACCIGIYPGLFAYLQSNRGLLSRLRSGPMSLGYSAGIILVVFAISLIFMLLQIELMNFMGQTMLIIDVIGFAVLSLIGIIYLTGRNFSIPLPRISPPKALMDFRGYRAARSTAFSLVVRVLRTALWCSSSP